jgi:hypothetical protein
MVFTEGNEDGDILERPTSKERNGENDLNHGWTRVNTDSALFSNKADRDFLDVKLRRVDLKGRAFLKPVLILTFSTWRRNSERTSCEQ